ncbi:MAG: EAL domain-containing protein [Gallionellaceae bacterium]
MFVVPTVATPSNPYLIHPERDLVTNKGKLLTLLNPAYALRDLQAIVSKDAPMQSHITSLNPINPNNQPDIWERAALQRFEKGDKEVVEVLRGDSQDHLRMMAPLIVEQPCLTCHAAQGYQLGDIRGGISSTISLAAYYADEHDRLVVQQMLHGIIWVVGLIGGIAFYRRERELVNEQLFAAARLRRYKEIIGHQQDGFMDVDKEGHVQEVNQAYAKMVGYTPEELTKMHISQLDVNDNPDAVKARIEEIAAKGGMTFETQHQHKDGRLIDIEVSTVCFQETSNLYAFCRDISERKKSDDEIKRIAFYDPLTGLANRRLMTDRMAQHLAHARRAGDLVAICMIDLDGFKQVNDQMGHKAGDTLLIEVARRLEVTLRHSDTASRFGGDEFALVLGGFKKISECEQSLSRIIASLAAPYQVNGQIAHVTGSVGATIFPNDGGTPDLLLRHADQSMYEAKQAGKNCYRLFNPSHQDQQLSNQATLQKIGKALIAGQFVLYYQPQVDCRQGRVIGVEALIRWNHPILGVLSPSEFIPLLEHDDLIITMGEWVIREALRQLAEWRQLGLDLTVGINIAARQLHQNCFTEHLAKLLAEYDTDVVSRLTIEIVETAALEDINLVAEATQQCRELGVHVAIDDFGTGFSSLTHLKHLRVDELKIDRSFVLGMLQNSEDLAIVNGVIGLASSFKHRVVAEGVESIDHILTLLELGCDVMQGFIIARAMPAAEVSTWLNKFEPDPLWQLSGSQRPSRDYFELLMAETNHRHWINSEVQNLRYTSTDFNPQTLLNYEQCQFGRWYYGNGKHHFGKEAWFRAIEPLHQSIHQSALKVAEYLRANNEIDAARASEKLNQQHYELDAMLKELRRSIANQYLTTNSKNKGD